MNLFILSLSLLVAIRATANDGETGVDGDDGQPDDILEEVKEEEKAETKVDPFANSMQTVSKILEHLYGEAVDLFSNAPADPEDPVNHATMNVDCTSTSEDGDFQTNVVTTLCPFLRGDDTCGAVRHPSYEVEDKDKFCSPQCVTHINALVEGVKNRGNLESSTEIVIFRDVSNAILRQYCASCRSGCYLPAK